MQNMNFFFEISEQLLTREFFLILQKTKTWTFFETGTFFENLWNFGAEIIPNFFCENTNNFLNKWTFFEKCMRTLFLEKMIVLEFLSFLEARTFFESHEHFLKILNKSIHNILSKTRTFFENREHFSNLWTIFENEHFLNFEHF